MNEEIRVHVVDYGRQSLYMRYLDPVTGKHITRTTGTSNKKAAEREAGKWEQELREGRYKSPSKITWKEFRERYEAEKLSGMSPAYAMVMNSAFTHLEKLEIEKLSRINADTLSRLQARMRLDGVGESTIRTYLKHLKAALAWAVKVKILSEMPSFEMPKRARTKSQMKGRPITEEEFGSILKATEAVRPDDYPMWQRYMTGLWLSGLRLRESLRLSWDENADFSVDLNGKFPRFRISAESQKSNRDELLPLTPDFAEWLLKTPNAERVGAVFDIGVKPDAVIGVVSKTGKSSGVKVSAVKHATAHDFRRSFGTRWSLKVKPPVLQKLMQHRDIKTTMDFYVSHESDDITADLWREHGMGNTSGNSDRKFTRKEKTDKPPKTSRSNLLRKSGWQDAN